VSDASAARIGIIGAMPEEVATLRPHLEHPREVQVGTFNMTEGVLHGHAVRLAVCGVGKVNAAALAQQMLSLGTRMLIFTGVAGAVDPDLRVGDVVVSKDALQHDVDVAPLGYAAGEVPGEPVRFQADSVLLKAAEAAAHDAVGASRVRTGTVASGDVFVADAAHALRLRDTFAATCAEMEGAAVAQVAHHWGVPWVVVRSISDTADHQASVDFRAFTVSAAQTAESVVLGILQRLPVAQTQPNASPSLR
jgi:adenosylhomocysteine nucleosidase